MNKPVRVGLVGLGNMGRNHLRVLSILRDVEIVFIYDADVTIAEKMSEKYGVSYAKDIKSRLHQIDALVIAVPTKYHIDYIRMAAGKVQHVFVEKPMVADIQEANEVVALRQQHNMNLTIGFIERFNPAVQEARNIIKQNKVINIDFTRTNKLSSRITDVDVVSDLMVHDIDLALYLNGPVKSIAAQGYLTDGMIGYASATLTHTNGAFSRIQASRITHKKDRMMRVTCEDIFMDCDLFKKEIVVNKQSQLKNLIDQPYAIQSVQENIVIRQEEALLLELQSFIDSCHKAPDASQGVPGIEAGIDTTNICAKIQNLIISNG